ncbi:SusC/RagA family TonB-linked outer membrane protein [Flavivirga spongiicola]|uniref:TonB-dependent receptor n=1 Tax=Flavivirga spongiicola TaxID=421621 RepID=A0ABU7XN36_9FLAO|nr:TonB-dependent receptor [Flavivirga sp. MEBiC05379]MDO5981822.1 TonB-dependent receptor [Flavivirga sp. MEBiC05379]
MRTFILLCFTTAFSFSPNSTFSQNAKIKIDANKTISVAEIFEMIQQQAGYKFIYSDDLIVNAPKIELKKGVILAKKLLDIGLKPIGCTFEFTENETVIVKRVSIPLPEVKPQISVKGTVVDTNGQPLPGANIIEKGTTNGVQTDFDGNFSLNVADTNAILIISYLGFFPQEITINNQTVINVTLQTDASGLDEVVVVAYGIQKKETLTSSVVEVKSEKLADVTVPEVATMLQGKVAGVQVLPSSGRPGSSPNVFIRGRSSIDNGNNEPLWVVDGVIFGNSDPKLNPNDVASLSVLKDASATALYGNRAANGVIIVTTKRGVKGTKPKMEVFLKTAINQFNTGNFEVMNSQQLYDFHQQLGNTEPWFTEDLLQRDYNWVEGLTQDALVKDASIRFTSATDTHNLLISSGYYDEESTVIGNDLKRYNFRTNLDYNITDKLTIKPKLYFVFDRRENVNEASLYQAYTNMPWDLPFASDGSVVNAQTAPGDDWIGRDRGNYFYDAQWNYTDSRSFDLFASFDFEYKLLPNLTFVSTNNFRWGHFESFSYTDPRSNSGRAFNGSVYDYNSRSLSRFTNQMLKYSNTFNEDHTLNVLAAYEYNDRSSRWFSAESQNVLVNGQVQNIGLEATEIQGSAGESAQQSFLFTADYDYKSKYFVKGSVRVDGASAFAPDYRYGTFYAAAAGWNIHKEGFFNTDKINKLKLRGSYGSVGNLIGGFAYLTTYNVEFQYAGVLAAKPARLGTPDVSWEKITEANIGLDATLFNAVDLTVDVYNKESSDLLFFRRLPDLSGFSGRFQNIGSVTNKGLEIGVSAHIVNKDDFGISVGANISFNNNEVNELPDGSDIFGAGNTIIREGEEFGAFYLRKWLGVHPANGEPVFEVVNEDGTRSTTFDYNAATLQVAGSANADFTGGFNTNIRYKDFTLSSNWSFSYGAELLNGSRTLFDSDGFYLAFNQMVLPNGWARWQQPGDIVTHPLPKVGGYLSSNQTSTRDLEDGSYLRLNNVRLSYNLPQSILDKVGISGANIYVSGDNLVTLTKFTGVDPTVNDTDGSGRTVLGTTNLSYPIPRRFALGLNLSF